MGRSATGRAVPSATEEPICEEPICDARVRLGGPVGPSGAGDRALSSGTSAGRDRQSLTCGQARTFLSRGASLSIRGGLPTRWIRSGSPPAPSLPLSGWTAGSSATELSLPDTAPRRSPCPIMLRARDAPTGGPSGESGAKQPPRPRYPDAQVPAIPHAWPPSVRRPVRYEDVQQELIRVTIPVQKTISMVERLSCSPLVVLRR